MFSSYIMQMIIRTVFLIALAGTLRAQVPIAGMINTYTPVAAFNGGDGIVVESTTGFSAGDMVLLIQMQGATVDKTSTDSSIYGSILRYENAGNYEIGIVRAIEGNIIRVQGGVGRSYDIGGKVQLVRVPRYQDVVIVGTLTAPRWDGRVGGVVALDASGSVIFEEDIDVSGAGFDSDIPLTSDIYQRDGLAYTRFGGNAAMKGNGIAERDAANEAGRGAFANGGGGGNAVNSGGGGGGNGGRGGKGGFQWDGSGTVDIGGTGGYALDYNVITDKLFFGGSGGNGDQNNQVGSTGGRGGGIVILNVCGIITGNNHRIMANGVSAGPAGIDAGGGGGAGGTVMLSAGDANGLKVEARGGDGGSPDNGRRAICHGTGGGGGGGVLRSARSLFSANNTYDLAGGKTGVARNPESPCFQQSYGADTGQAGVFVDDVPRVGTGSDTTICTGDSIALSAHGSPFATYQWSPQTTLSCATCANPVAHPSATTSYVVAITQCGFTRRDTVTVNVVSCGDTTSDLIYYLPTRCQGATERVWLSFYNRVRTDSAARIAFLGPQAADYTLDTALPFSLTPTKTIYFPVIHRWTTPGRNETILEMKTSSGITYRIKLVAITEQPYTPVLNVSELHLGEHADLFDTCFTVKNTYYTRVVLTDTAWVIRGGRYRIISPSLPIYIAPGGTANICMRVSELGPSSRGTLTLGGTVIDSCGIGRCVAQVIEIDSKRSTSSVGGVEDRESHMLCYPNPSAGVVHVEFPVHARSRVRLQVIDMQGREVALLVDENLERGRYDADLDTRGLPNGKYIVRMEQGNETEMMVISVVR